MAAVWLFHHSAAGQEKKSDPAKPVKTKEPNPYPKPAKRGGPRHDPQDIPFRRAPMSAATRSVVFSVSSNLFLAFDTETLRYHTAWTGGPLNLWGAAYHGGKDRFYCDFDGTVLWSMPPIMPWLSRTLPDETTGGGWTNAVPESHFKAISTKNGVTTLIYDLRLPEGKLVRIHETARHPTNSPPTAIERRIEISPVNRSLTLLLHAERGRFDEREDLPVAILDRGTNVLIIANRGNCRRMVEPFTPDVDYTSTLWTESKGESVPIPARYHGPEARCSLRIPASTNGPLVIEVLTFVAPDRESGLATWRNYVAQKNIPPLSPPNMTEIYGHSRNSNSPPPAIFYGDRSIQAPGGDEYYRTERFPVPKEIELQVTGMDFMPNGDLAVCTWLGDVYIVHNPTGDPREATYRRYARGLCEPCGLKVISGSIYVAQKCELTRLVDTDGNGEADAYDCISQDWGFTGNYHDFTFGPVVDRDGTFHVYRNGNHGIYTVPYMGWDIAVGPGRPSLPVCSGLRSPNGFGVYGPNQDLFMTDNQGNWIGACKLNHLQPGHFYGFPSTKPAPLDEFQGHRKDFSPPAVWFPYKMAKSSSGFATIADDRFGPFQGQLVVGDFQNAIVTRVMIEQVNGEWQGAVWPMLKGFASGVNRVSYGPDGKLYVGGLKNAAWAAVAPMEYSLERVAFTGKIPFEVREVHAKPDGFELTFTQPVDAISAGNPDSYDVAQYAYLYHQTYGSPEIDQDGKPDSSTPIKVTRATVSADRLKVNLALSGWKPGYVTLVRGLDVKNGEGKNLWHDTFYYTLNQIPR